MVFASYRRGRMVSSLILKFPVVVWMVGSMSILDILLLGRGLLSTLLEKRSTSTSQTIRLESILPRGETFRRSEAIACRLTWKLCTSQPLGRMVRLSTWQTFRRCGYPFRAAPSILRPGRSCPGRCPCCCRGWRAFGS